MSPEGSGAWARCRVCLHRAVAVAVVAQPRALKHECPCRRVAWHRVSHRVDEKGTSAGRRWWWQPSTGVQSLRGWRTVSSWAMAAARGQPRVLEPDPGKEGLHRGCREKHPSVSVQNPGDQEVIPLFEGGLQGQERDCRSTKANGKNILHSSLPEELHIWKGRKLE